LIDLSAKDIFDW